MAYQDPSDDFANRKDAFLKFLHVPTGQTAIFKAFITNLQDNFTSNWASEAVYGRMDEIHTFQGTTRQIELAWDVVASSEEEGKRNFAEATKLYSMLYPVYGTSQNASSIAAAPLMKLKFGNLIETLGPGQTAVSSESDVVSHGLLGRVTGFSFAPDLDSGFFDHEPGTFIPQTLQLSCTYHVLHTHALGFDKEGKLRGKEVDSFPYNIGDGSSTVTEVIKAAAGPGNDATQRQNEKANKDILS
jgi:hypothetical protein|tara:strand:+ start:69 stop:800 length:732 start_codon:yes stop_codon:yes gene_type:complete